MSARLYYDGSDGQRHAATVLARHSDGCETIRRGYYDPIDGTTLRTSAADRPMYFGPPAPLTPCPRHEEPKP
jgi:hypothetical protein